MHEDVLHEMCGYASYVDYTCWKLCEKKFESSISFLPKNAYVNTMVLDLGPVDI